MRNQCMPYDEKPAVPAGAGGDHMQPFDPSGARPRERLIHDEFMRTARRVRVDPGPEAFLAVLARVFPPRRPEKSR